MTTNKAQLKLSLERLLILFILFVVHNQVKCNHQIAEDLAANSESSSVALLTSLCQNKQVKLESISQVRQLAKQLSASQYEQSNQSKDNCAQYLNSILDLDNVLAYVEAGRTCNLEMVDRLRQYQYKYITLNNPDDASIHDDKNKKHQLKPLEPIPKALTKFFIALGFQISAECKIVMINNLENDTKGTITEMDYKLIEYLEQNGASFLNDDDQITDYDDVMLINDITDQVGGRKLLIKAKTNEQLRRLLSACTKKFKPLYEKLIMPLIELSNLGYNYQGELLARELIELKENKLVRRWYNIMQTCESFSYVELQQDDEEGKNDDADQGDKVKMIDNNQVLTLVSTKNEQGKKVSEQNEQPAIEYNPVSRNSDELWVLRQDNIEQMIERYEVQATEASRIRNKLLKRLLGRLKHVLLTGRMLSFVSEIIRDSGKQPEQKPNKGEVVEGLVEILDEAVASDEQEVNKIDTRVSWPGKSSRRNKEHAIPARNLAYRAATKVNGSRMSSKVYDCLIGRFIPSRWTIFFWIIAIASILLIIGHFAG